MDWKKIIGSVAPTIATALGSPLAGMATSTILKTLGIESEKQIEEAVKDPEALLKLKQAENIFTAQMKELDIKLDEIIMKDKDSARQREIAVKDKTPQILAYAYTLGYFTILGVTFKFGVPENGKEMINILIGILSAAQVGIIQYYFGSSAGSKQKTEVLTNRESNK